MMKYTTHGVLAGAYRGKDIGERRLLLHTCNSETLEPICNTVPADSICDEELQSPPTCPKCVARLVKLLNMET